MPRATIAPMPRSRPEPAARPQRLRRPTHLLAAGLIALVGACNTPTPPASPSPAHPSAAACLSNPVGSTDLTATYRAIEDQVVAIRGLTPKTPVNPTVVDAAGIAKVTADDFTKSNPPDLVAANERVLKAFGLLPADASLKDLYLKLLGGAVAGLYSPSSKKLYVVSRTGGIGPVERSTFAHEFTHALQDQTFDIGSLRMDEVGQGDRSFARLSLVEGDATLAQTFWTIQNLSSVELQQLLACSSQDGSTAILLSMPPILRESLLFPYTSGLGFVQGIQTAGGWAAVNAAFAKPPASTEQILHPDKYAASEGPLPADLPADLLTRLGAGWKVALQDVFGEFQLALWLRQNRALSAADANAAAAGWGGDRVALVEGPNGTWGVILRTVWDTDADAAAFESAAADSVEQLPSPAGLIPGTGRDRWILIGSNDDTLHHLASVLELGS